MPKDQSNWLASSLMQHHDVAHTRRVERNVIEVVREQMPPVLVGIVATDKVLAEDIIALLDREPPPGFIVSVPNSGTWSGDAVSLAEGRGIAFGRMYDLYRGLRENEHLEDYVSPERYHVERMLRQHRNVSSLIRMSDRSYRVCRILGDDVIVALSQDYEMTADAVRTAFDRYAPFDVLLKTTPYGGISKQGRTAAAELSIKVLNADGLYSYLCE
jgi:hypothetical protein